MIIKKNPFPIFGILSVVGIGIYMLQWQVKDTAVIIGIIAAGTVIFAIIFFVLYKMGYRAKGGN